MLRRKPICRYGLERLLLVRTDSWPLTNSWPRYFYRYSVLFYHRQSETSLYWLHSAQGFFIEPGHRVDFCLFWREGLLIEFLLVLWIYWPLCFCSIVGASTTISRRGITVFVSLQKRKLPWRCSLFFAILYCWSLPVRFWLWPLKSRLW